MKKEQYDIIVAGAGHAGCEAAYSAAKLGSKVLLITMNMDAIAQMSCNPSIGGIAKGQIVREIDALGGMMGIVADKTTIQFRMLNRSKGPAMWSPRAQIDRFLYSKEWRKILENTENLEIREDTVVDVETLNNEIKSVKTRYGKTIKTKTLILTSGTFLNGIIHIGEKHFSGGRMKEPAVIGLTESLKKIGFVSERMKTGTPVRIDGRTVDFSKLIEQAGDENPEKFSFSKETSPPETQRSCYLAYTDLNVHEILKKGFDQSPMFVGRIQGIGPRYCPSIEDKIERFADKNKHQLFLEPEGWDTVEYYLNGFSSSLPEEIQYEALKKIKGFEQVKIYRPGYAIEYDFFPPSQIKYTMETKKVKGLYFAGQLNGTTGYEEAAAQGLVAGINAHNKTNNKEDFILKRHEAYIGVLVDDLVTKIINEPYRMFTSRAEFRILLRQDNADLRLTEKGFEIGLVSKKQIEKLREKKIKIDQLIAFLKKTSIEPSQINLKLKEIKSSLILQKNKIQKLLLRPEISINDIVNCSEDLQNYIAEKKIEEKQILQQVEIQIKYEAYIKKEKELSEKLNKFENIKLKRDLDYTKMNALSLEAREKLNNIKPETISQASRISGISPADISALLILLGK
jgi:tRNA uridine 5-carboxymethylaminomethyl modification enzyme